MQCKHIMQVTSCINHPFNIDYIITVDLLQLLTYTYHIKSLHCYYSMPDVKTFMNTENDLYYDIPEI